MNNRLPTNNTLAPRSSKEYINTRPIRYVKCNTKKANRTPEQANMKLLKVPRKPRINILRCDFKVKDWETFLGASYWLVELENDC